MRIKPKHARGQSALGEVSSPKEDKELKRLEKICQLMLRNQLSEIEWETKGERLRLRSGIHAAPAPVHYAPAPSMAAPAPAAASGTPGASAGSEAPSAMPSNQKQVTSPFVGTFYRAPAPTAEPYVREGQVIKKGDVLCIIEAMKLMNEIEAEFPGRIVSILVENGQPVEFGEPLFVVEV